MKYLTLFPALLVTLLGSVASPMLAQSRPAGVASLGEMACQTMQGADSRGGMHAVNRDYAIGFEVFTAVLALGDRSHGEFHVKKNEPTQVACRLSIPQQRSQYRSLTLAFGSPESNVWHDPSDVTRFSIYVDGVHHTYQDIRRGDTYLLTVNIENVNSIGLEARCLSADRDNSCGGVYFFEDILE